MVRRILAPMTRGIATRTLATPQLVLQPFRRRDVSSLAEAVEVSNDDLVRWLPWAHRGYGRADAVGFIRESMTAWRDGRAYDFSIRSVDDPDRHLGNISVWPTNRTGLIGEMGYWVRSDETGKGIASQAGARMVQLAFEDLGMHRVVMRIAVGNEASERVAVKLGFAREGLLRQEVKVAGEWLDHSAWGILRTEFETEKPRYQAQGWLRPA